MSDIKLKVGGKDEFKQMREAIKRAKKAQQGQAAEGKLTGAGKNEDSEDFAVSRLQSTTLHVTGRRGKP